MKKIKWESERVVALLITSLIILSISHYLFDLWDLLIAKHPFLMWLCAAIGGMIIFCVEKTIEAFLQKYNKQQEEQIRLYKNIIKMNKETPDKLVEINQKLKVFEIEIKELKGQGESVEDDIIRLQSYIAALSTESLLSTMIYIQDQLGILRQNFHEAEYDGQKGVVVILNQDNYEEFVVKEQNSGSLLNLQTGAIFDGDSTTPL